MVGLKAPPPKLPPQAIVQSWGWWVGQGDLPSALGPWLGRQLYKQELERQKARTLQLSWKEEKPLWETSQEPDSTSQTQQAEPEHPEEAVEAEEEEVSGPSLVKCTAGLALPHSAGEGPPEGVHRRTWAPHGQASSNLGHTHLLAC